MRKLIFLGASAILISAGVIAQSSEPENRVKTKKETRSEARQQVRADEQAPQTDPLTTRKQVREQLRTQDPSGDPIMQQTRSREKIHQQAPIGDPAMKQTRSREKIHQPDPEGGQAGRANRAATYGKRPGAAANKNHGGKSPAANSPAKAPGQTRRSAMQARPAAKMQGSTKGIRTHRPAARGSGTGR